jgi:MFS family permease
MSKGTTVGSDAYIAQKITTTLFAAHSLASAALLVSGTVCAIAGTQLSDNPAWAGVPSAVQQLGTAFAALAVSFALDRLGRRRGLALGLAVGALGAGLAATAIAVEAIGEGAWPLFLVGLALLGTATATMRLGRFVAAQVHPPDSRGRAISYVVAGGAVGAVLGPLLVGPSNQWALQAGIDGLAGPFAITLGIFTLTSLALLIWLRPEPHDVEQRIAARYPEAAACAKPTRSISQIFHTPEVLIAVVAMAIGQTVMGMVMVITSLHMKAHQHTLTDISLVVSAHTLGMYAFSVLSGRLTDKWGRGPVILAGAAILVLSCVLAPLSSNVLPLTICLFLLGLGWNLCYVGGSTLLSDHLSSTERTSIQGINDWLMSLVTAGGSFASGLVFAGRGYAALGVVGALVSLVPLGATAWWMIGKHGRFANLLTHLRAAQWRDVLHFRG